MFIIFKLYEAGENKVIILIVKDLAKTLVGINWPENVIEIIIKEKANIWIKVILLTNTPINRPKDKQEI